MPFWEIDGNFIALHKVVAITRPTAMDYALVHVEGGEPITLALEVSAEDAIKSFEEAYTAYMALVAEGVAL